LVGDLGGKFQAGDSGVSVISGLGAGLR
jgi:hypothetical protein